MMYSPLTAAEKGLANLQIYTIYSPLTAAGKEFAILQLYTIYSAPEKGFANLQLNMIYSPLTATGKGICKFTDLHNILCSNSCRGKDLQIYSST